jgi:hypothetical protein
LEESGLELILRHYPSIRLKELRKNTKILSQDSGLRDEISTRDLLNTKEE